MQTATQKTKKVSKVQTIVSTLKNTNEGMAVQLPENATSKDVEKAKRILTTLQESKRDLKNSVNEKRNSLSYNLKLIKDDCKNEASKYVDELNSKYELTLKNDSVFKLLCKPSDFIPYLTESQKIKFTEKRLNFTPSLIIEAISRYYKTLAKGI